MPRARAKVRVRGSVSSTEKIAFWLELGSSRDVRARVKLRFRVKVSVGDFHGMLSCQVHGPVLGIGLGVPYSVFVG